LEKIQIQAKNTAKKGLKTSDLASKGKRGNAL